MKTTKETVLQWLQAHHHTREWLAEKCQVKKRTVDNWLVSPQPIPSKSILIIERLMETDRQTAIEAQTIPHHLVLEFDNNQFEQICQVAAAEKKTPRAWSIDTLNEIATADLNEIKEHTIKRVAEEPIDYNHNPTPQKKRNGTDHP